MLDGVWLEEKLHYGVVTECTCIDSASVRGVGAEQKCLHFEFESFTNERE